MLLVFVLMLGSCAGNIPSKTIMGVPIRTGSEQDNIDAVDPALLEKLQHGEISIDEGLLPKIRINYARLVTSWRIMVPMRPRRQEIRISSIICLQTLRRMLQTPTTSLGIWKLYLPGVIEPIPPTLPLTRLNKWENTLARVLGLDLLSTAIITAWIAAFPDLKQHLIFLILMVLPIPVRTAVRKKAKKSLLRRSMVRALRFCPIRMG